MQLIKDVTNLPNTLYWYPRTSWGRHQDRVRKERTVWVINTDKIAGARDDLFVCPHRDVETLRRKAKDAKLPQGSHCFVEFGPMSFLVNGTLMTGAIHEHLNTHQTIIDIAFSGAVLAHTLLLSEHPDIKGICGVDGDPITEGVTHLAGVKVFGKGAIFTPHQPHFFITSLAHGHGLQVMAMADVKAEGLES